MNFEEELTELINRHSQENGSDTPDSILAEYLCDCLDFYGKAIRARDKWYQFDPWTKLSKQSNAKK